MAATSKEVYFTEHWPTFCLIAAQKGYTHKNGGLASGSFMEACGLKSARFAEFENAYNKRRAKPHRQLTAYYYQKIKGGLGVTDQEIEKISGKTLSAEQKEELQLNTWVQAHRDLIKELIKDPAKLKICKDICNLSD